VTYLPPPKTPKVRAPRQWQSPAEEAKAKEGDDFLAWVRLIVWSANLLDDEDEPDDTDEQAP
jgi:hypothetical protein